MNLVHEVQYPTTVIKMDVDDDLVADLKRELVLRSKIDAAISDMAAGTYFPLSTQFEHSILMTDDGPEILTQTQTGPQKGHLF